MINNPIHSHFRLFLSASNDSFTTELKENIPIEDIQKMIDGFHAFHQLQLEQYGNDPKRIQQLNQYYQDMISMLDKLDK